MGQPRRNLNGIQYSEEFLPQLRGFKGVETYREMRDNDPMIGASMYAIEQVLRDVSFKVKPAKEPEGEESKEDEFVKFVEEVLNDMEHTLDDHVSQALSYLTYGFADFEIVYKRRRGKSSSKKFNSKYSDDKIGVRKLAPRVQHTISKFDVDDKTGEFLGIQQISRRFNGTISNDTIPVEKILHYKTPTMDDDPSGRSILRNAFKPYYHKNNFEYLESISIEREMQGVPIIRIPSEDMQPDEDGNDKPEMAHAKQIGQQLQEGGVSFVILSSDPWVVGEKTLGGTGTRRVDIELITSNGSRNMDIDVVIRRYDNAMITSILTNFLRLGQDGVGSYALDKSKTDLFVRSVESYINSIADVLNKQLLPRLWAINGFPEDRMPKIVFDDVAPANLQALSSFMRNLNQAEISIADLPDTVEDLFEKAELVFNKDDYKQKQEERQEKADKIAEQQQNEPFGNNPNKGNNEKVNNGD